MVNAVRFSCCAAALSASALLLVPLPLTAMPVGPVATGVASQQLLRDTAILVPVQQKKRAGGGGMGMQQMQMIQQMVPQEYMGYVQNGLGGMGGAAGSGTLPPPGDVMSGNGLPPGMGGSAKNGAGMTNGLGKR